MNLQQMQIELKLSLEVSLTHAYFLQLFLGVKKWKDEQPWLQHNSPNTLHIDFLIKLKNTHKDRTKQFKQENNAYARLTTLELQNYHSPANYFGFIHMLLSSFSFHKRTDTVEVKVGCKKGSAIKDKDYPAFGLYTLLLSWRLALYLSCQ